MGHNYPYKLWHTILRIYTDNICCSPGKRRQQQTKSGQLAAFFNQGQFSPKRCYSNFNSETLVYSKIYQVLYRKYIKKPLTKTTREEASRKKYVDPDLRSFSQKSYKLFSHYERIDRMYMSRQRKDRRGKKIKQLRKCNDQRFLYNKLIFFRRHTIK